MNKNDIGYMAIAGKKNLVMVRFEPALKKFAVFRVGRPSLGEAVAGDAEYRTRAADAFKLARTPKFKATGAFIAVEYNAPLAEVAEAAERILDAKNRRTAKTAEADRRKGRFLQEEQRAAEKGQEEERIKAWLRKMQALKQS